MEHRNQQDCCQWRTKLKSSNIKEKAYKAILRPKLEYCSSIWDPRKGIESNGSYRLEMVQRRAARWVLSRYGPLASITDMLTDLGWTTLKHWRVVARLVLLFKIVNGLVAVDPRDNLKKPTRSSRHAKEHSFLSMSCNTESHRISFYPRTVNQWICGLPQSIFVKSQNDVKSLNH